MEREYVFKKLQWTQWTLKKKTSENHAETSIDVKLRSCYMYDNNSIISLLKKKSSLVTDDEILNWEGYRLMCL